MSHFFTKASLRVGAKQTRELLVNSYREHQLLWDLFPKNPEGQRDFICRRTQHADKVEYYVVSKREPVQESALWLIHGSKPYQPKLSEGVTLAFELRANPVVAKNGQKHDVVMDLKKRLKVQEKKMSQSELEQTAGLEWINRKATQHGFSLDGHGVMVSNYQPITAKKRSQSGGISLRSLDFKGTLTVTDPDKFSQVLCSGIGSAKAFGCGLLLVRPV